MHVLYKYNSNTETIIHICTALLALCILMESIFWFDTIDYRLGIVHCTYIGASDYNNQINILLFYLNSLFTFIISVDPDETPHYSAFHMGLHCL